MKERKYAKQLPALLLMGLLALLLLLLATGRANAHFETNISKSKTLQYTNSESELYILSAAKDENGAYLTDENGNILPPESWTSVAVEVDTGEIDPLTGETLTETVIYHELPLLLANGKRTNAPAETTQHASLTLFATEGIGSASAVHIVLQSNGSEYIAAPTEVKAGSAWHDAYGAGWTYRFYNGAGEELSWAFTGGTFSSQEMTLSVYGGGADASILTLIVAPVVEKNAA